MSGDDMTPLYVLDNVRRTFRRGPVEVRAVDGVDLTVAPGEFIAIEGPSGSGKSTLLQLLGGLERPTGGRLTFAGDDLATRSDSELTRFRAHDVGFVFQHFNLIPTLTARENVQAALAVGTLPAGERAGRSEVLLASVGLADRADHLPVNLSGGEQQRVAIARALANGPRVVLADEPTGNLDSATSREIIAILERLSNDGVAVIVVTHADHVAAAARRRLAMRDGRLEPAA
jgi:putative ABC transport system ATP-binding protein